MLDDNELVRLLQPDDEIIQLLGDEKVDKNHDLVVKGRTNLFCLLCTNFHS